MCKWRAEWTFLPEPEQLGIQTEFVDGQGHAHVTDAMAFKIILDALPVRAPYRFLRELVVIRSGEPARTELNEAATPPLHWKIVAGQRVIAQGKRMIAPSPGLPVCPKVPTGCI